MHSTRRFSDDETASFCVRRISSEYVATRRWGFVDCDRFAGQKGHPQGGAATGAVTIRPVRPCRVYECRGWGAGE